MSGCSVNSGATPSSGVWPVKIAGTASVVKPAWSCGSGTTSPRPASRARFGKRTASMRAGRVDDRRGGQLVEHDQHHRRRPAARGGRLELVGRSTQVAGRRQRRGTRPGPCTGRPASSWLHIRKRLGAHGEHPARQRRQRGRHEGHRVGRPPTAAAPRPARRARPIDAPWTNTRHRGASQPDEQAGRPTAPAAGRRRCRARRARGRCPPTSRKMKVSGLLPKASSTGWAMASAGGAHQRRETAELHPPLEADVQLRPPGAPSGG